MAIFIGSVFAKYNMQTEFVVVECDVHCLNQGKKPVYRAYVNDELFTERSWIWNDCYLNESFQIQAPAGRYQIRYEFLDGSEFETRNWRVVAGPAGINQQGSLEIHHASK
jgi:hypothetical protein